MVYCQRTLVLQSSREERTLPISPGKHTPYYELVDAQSQAGCPICRLVYRATDRYLDSLLYEAVLDPEVRARLRRSRGFCREHTEMLRRKPGRALGIALIYRDIVRAVSDIAYRERGKEGRSRAGRHPRGPLRGLLGRRRARASIASALSGQEQCPACGIARKAEHNHIELLLAHLHDERLHEAYASGEGLCLSHFIQALGSVEDEEGLRLLIEPQMDRYRLMLADLDEFIRKRDHRFRHESYGEEGDVWLRALNAITGGAGMGLSARWGGRRSDDIVDHRR